MLAKFSRNAVLAAAWFLWLLWPTVQATAGDTNGCVFVSNDHGDALEEWLRATAGASRPLAVFHVDAHNDLNVPEGREPLTSPASSAELRRRWQHNSTLLHQLTAGVDLANFQLAAVRAGVVDRIVWVRQSSPSDGLGNGRAHQALHSVHSLRLEDGAFDDDEIYSSTSYDAAAESAALAQASVHGIGFAFHEVPEHALSQPQLVRQLADLLDAQGYLLDIDLDFFAHGARHANPRASQPPQATTLLTTTPTAPTSRRGDSLYLLLQARLAPAARRGAGTSTPAGASQAAAAAAAVAVPSLLPSAHSCCTAAGGGARLLARRRSWPSSRRDMSSRRRASGCSAQARPATVGAPWTMWWNRRVQRTRQTRRMRRMVHRMLRRAARGGGARRRWRVGRAARRRCCRRGFTRRRRRSLSRRRSARGDRRRRCRARARRRVRRRAESAALVAPQLAAAAAWDARLWAWAAPRTPEERLRCSDPSCDIWRRHRPVPKPAHVRLPTPHRCHATCAARPARAAAGRAAQPTRRHDICTLGGRPAIRDTSNIQMHMHMQHPDAHAHAHAHAHARMHTRARSRACAHTHTVLYVCRLGGRLPSDL